MLGTNKWSNERKSLGITESYYEGIKEGPLLGFNNNIIDSVVIWGTVGSPEGKQECKRVDHPDGNHKIFPVRTSDGATLGLIENTMIGISDYSKLWKEPGFGIPE